MLYFDRIYISKGSDVQKECINCQYVYFLDKGFKFQLDVCNGCHGVLVIPMNLNDSISLKIRRVDYHCVMNEISKSQVVKLLQNADLNKKVG